MLILFPVMLSDLALWGETEVYSLFQDNVVRFLLT